MASVLVIVIVARLTLIAKAIVVGRYSGSLFAYSGCLLGELRRLLRQLLLMLS